MKQRHTIGIMCCFAVLLASTAFAATETLRPTAQGTYSAWTNTGCSAGSGEWDCVEETSANTADYVETGTNGNKETFTFSDIAANVSSISSLTIYYYAQRVKAADKCFSPMIRANSTDYLSGVQKCSTASYALYSHTYNTNPATGSAWTKTAVNALEAGMYALDPNGGGRVAQVYAIVNYNASVCGNNVVEDGEVCDGSALNGNTCVSRGHDGGSLSCAGDCLSFVETSCYDNSCSDSDGGFVKPHKVQSQATMAAVRTSTRISALTQVSCSSTPAQVTLTLETTRPAAVTSPV